MSWDIIFMRTPDTIKAIKDIPKDFEAPVLGSRSEIIELLRKILPDWDFSRGWGVYEEQDFSITLDLVPLKNTENINSLFAHISGEGNALQILETIWTTFDCSAFDCSTGKCLHDSKSPDYGFRAWKKYRDFVLSKNKDSLNEDKQV